MVESKVIFIAGGTGFIGKHFLRALKEAGHSVRCLARSEESAGACTALGFETARGDITERGTLKGALKGVRTVVHLVGIIEERGRQTFQRVHVEGTENLVAEAKEAGVEHFFYQSALGASADSPAVYHRTKARAEETVRASGIPFTIFRPSLVIGEGSGFVAKIGELLSKGPVIPVPGSGEARFQPIFVEDLARCFLKVMDNPAEGKVYELGGPEHLSYNRMIEVAAEVMGVKKPMLHIPAGLARLGVKLLERTPFRPATSEQLMLLEMDNICDPEGVKKGFGFDPVPFREALARSISPRARGR